MMKKKLSSYTTVTVLMVILFVMLPMVFASDTDQIRSKLSQEKEQHYNIYTNKIYGYSLNYPVNNWYPVITLENKGKPEHVIKERATFFGPDNAIINIDVWETGSNLDLMEWFKNHQVPLMPKETEFPGEPNLVIAGVPGIFVVEPEIYPAPSRLISILKSDLTIFRIEYIVFDGGRSQDIYQQILSTFRFYIKDTHGKFESKVMTFPKTYLEIPTANYLRGDSSCCDYSDPGNPYSCGYCGGYHGNCTWWASYKRPDFPDQSWGNAWQWLGKAQEEGFPTGSTPQIGAVVVYPQYWCGSNEICSYGHVAYVEEVYSNSYEVSEMGYCSWECKRDTIRNIGAYNENYVYFKNQTSWEFNTDGNTDGWTAYNVESYSVSGGIFYLDPAASDPYMTSPLLSVNASNYTVVLLRMASNAPDGVGAIYFKTLSEDYYSEDKKVAFTVANEPGGSANYYDYSIYMAGNSRWTGTITGIRIDPSENGIAGTALDTIGFDYIRLSMAQEPQLVASSPANGTTDVSVSHRTIFFTFDQRMQAGYSVTWSGLDVTPSFVTWRTDGKTIYFAYPTDLPASRTIGWLLNPSTYELSFRNESGVPLPADEYRGSFSTTTTPAPTQFAIEVSVQYHYPENYYLGIAVVEGNFTSFDVIGPHIVSVWDSIVVSLSERPTVGDTYIVRLYDDDAFEDKTYAVDGVNDHFAWIISPADGSTVSTLTPTFTWQEAADISSYRLIVQNAQGNWIWQKSFPVGTSSCVYNFDGSATANLQSGKTYTIYLHTFDVNNNQATTQSTFTVQIGNSYLLWTK